MIGIIIHTFFVPFRLLFVIVTFFILDKRKSTLYMLLFISFILVYNHCVRVNILTDTLYVRIDTLPGLPNTVSFILVYVYGTT